MAIHTLPNGSIYNTSLDWGMQSSGSHDFWQDVQETTTPVQTTEQTRNPSRNRVLKEVYTDTSYSGSNYIVTTNNIYRHGPGSNQCFALQGSNIGYSIENK
jgi:hypothetical protein